MEHGKSLGVLFRLQEHCEAAETQQRVDPDVDALGVLDGSAEELVEIGGLAGEGIASGLESCPDDVGANFPVSCVLACGSLVQVAGQVGPLSILKVLGCDGGDDTSRRVPGQRNLLVKSELEKLVAERRLLVIGQIGPMPCDELPGLDSG